VNLFWFALAAQAFLFVVKKKPKTSGVSLNHRIRLLTIGTYLTLNPGPRFLPLFNDLQSTSLALFMQSVLFLLCR
jgi:hypothetical protein